MLLRTVLVLGLAVAPSVSIAQTADTTATKAAILAADRALAQEAATGGAETFIAALDEAAAVLFPGQPILKSASAVRAPFSARYATPSSYSWSPVHAVVGNDGKFGCTMGYSRFTNALDSVKSEHRGTYLTCWEKGSKGRWRVVGTQRNDSPGAAPLLVDSITLPGAPHSAIHASGKQLAAAQDADSLFAMEGGESAGPGPAFARYAADDAMMVGGPEFPRGKKSIADAFTGYPATRVIWWRPMRGVGAGSGGLAYTVGNSTSGPRSGQTGPTYYNKYMTVWRQEPDGKWLYVFDLGTSRPAP